MVVFVWNVLVSLRRGERAGNDPWRAPSLEWAAASPPKPYTFGLLPVVRSRHPLWDDAQPIGGVETAADRGEYLRPQISEERREAFGTSVMDAEPESRIYLTKPTLWPLLAALAVGFAFVGSMFTLWSVPIGALLFYFAMIGWFKPFNPEEE